MLNEQTYLDLMTPFLSFLRQTVRPVGNELAYYGTGESAHWPVQSNFNVAGALGVLATTPHELPVSKDELLETALRLFRYNLATHITGSRPATDGKSWGNTWIAILGLERMTHGINALEPFFSSADRDRFRTLRLNESDWLLSEYPVVAGMTASSGKNKPESNIWNGGFLLRAAMDYPDAPNRDAYLEKACSFLLNGLSHPLDAASETMFHGKPLREWHKGFNFTPGYSLDHHGYMNVGYSVICLSNLAMLHFNFKERGQTPPPELYHHVRDLWDVVRNFIFADGRLLRIGGDTRARYCYCQNYLLPIQLFVQDLLGETDSASKEAQWLGIVGKERFRNADGSFFGERLANIRRGSYYYYTRLESDAFLSLSCGAYWRRKFGLLQPPETASVNPPAEWSDDYHCANLLRTGNTIRSAVRRGGEGPVVLCTPADRSDLAEWGGNGFAQLNGHMLVPSCISSFHKTVSGGFLNAGTTRWLEHAPWGEGEGEYAIAESRSAAAALPDGCSLIVLEQLRVIKECTLESVRGLGWKLPNDIFNGMTRHIQGNGFSQELRGCSGEQIIDTGSQWLNVDNVFSIILGYGADSLKVYSPAERSGALYYARALKSLYMHEICAGMTKTAARRMPGELLADTGYAAIAGITASGTAGLSMRRLELPDPLRAVEFDAPDGCRYRFTANFGDTPVDSLSPGECTLETL